jgi:hypothetical protein
MFKGECFEERCFNADSDELRRLTGQDRCYLGPNALTNMYRDLETAREKAKTSSQRKREKKSNVQALNHMFAKISEERLRNFAKEWMELKTLESKHVYCTDNEYTQCRGCDKIVCSHLANYVSTSVPVCSWCDTYVQPNPFNQINRKPLLPVSYIADKLCKHIDDQ